jgi:hypothetical protein
MGIMTDRIVEVHDGGGSGLTAIAIVLLVAVLLAVLYFTGVFGRALGDRDTKIDVDINKPSAVLFVG